MPPVCWAFGKISKNTTYKIVPVAIPETSCYKYFLGKLFIRHRLRTLNDLHDKVLLGPDFDISDFGDDDSDNDTDSGSEGEHADRDEVLDFRHLQWDVIMLHELL